MQAVTDQIAPAPAASHCARAGLSDAANGQDELTLLSQAMRLGLGLLYSQTAEQAFIDDVLTRPKRSRP